MNLETTARGNMKAPSFKKLSTFVVATAACCSNNFKQASAFTTPLGTLGVPAADTTTTIRLKSPSSYDSTPATTTASFVGTSPGGLSSRGARRQRHSSSATSTSLNVWWYGGSDREEEDSDACELVPVRIESPTRNSRRIMGQIDVDRPLEDVWAILTDYDNLAKHVPNLVESRRVAGGQQSMRQMGVNGMPQAGDGSYTCRLFQRGAQKIVGFEFGASLTMEMQEMIVVSGGKSQAKARYASTAGPNIVLERQGMRDPLMFPPERRISFKCVDSNFFSAFDGTWSVKEVVKDGKQVTTIDYKVLVKPRGPVPVAALEWRIREDVPTNLRAVKKAAQRRGLFMQNSQYYRGNNNGAEEEQLIAAEESWEDSETMAVYLN